MLKNANTVLRPWTEQDIEVLEQLRNDVVLQAMLMTQPRPNSEQRVLEWLAAKTDAENGLFFVIADSKSNNAIGYLQVVNINQQNGTCELGICLSPDVQGRGYGAAAIHALVDYLRTTFNLRKLMLHVLADNSGAIAFYLKTGFTEAGLLKEHFYHDGQYKDVVIMEKFLQL
jgi:RimJ/RimL family protein N-acetyltransferase